MRTSVELLKIQISLLLDQHPELNEDADLRADMLEGSTDLNEIVEKLLLQEREAADMVEAIKLRMDKIAERRNKYKNRQQSIRFIILSILQRAGVRKLVFPEATVAITNKGRSVVVHEPDMVPDHLCKISREPMKTLIKEALVAGDDIPGAMLDNGGETLRIS